MKPWNSLNFLKNFCVVVFKENVYHLAVKMLQLILKKNQVCIFFTHQFVLKEFQINYLFKLKQNKHCLFLRARTKQLVLGDIFFHSHCYECVNQVDFLEPRETKCRKIEKKYKTSCRYSRIDAAESLHFVVAQFW